jgi:hypothetical protein
LQTAKIPPLTTSSGNILTTPEEKAKACKEHLQDQWKETLVSEGTSFPWHCPRLSPIQSNNIARPISLEEVDNAISQSPNNKAPGPDGIPSEFYKQFKDILIPRLTAIFDEILQTGSNAPISWMQSKCVLIPKKTQGLDQLANWRPITLENCDLKIFSRILANRTQAVMNSIIGEQQTGFIAGRCIHHSVLSIETALHSGTKGSYMLSLDWSKAYDKVNHKWLTHCLQSFGFPVGFIRTIKLLFFHRNAEVSVEESTQYVQCKQGVPQGDPIAPLLFVIALEPLLAAARVEVEGIETPKGTLTNAAFADDSTFFILNDRNVMRLVDLLRSFSEVSGAVINWHKSALTPLSNSPPNQNTPFPLTPIQQPPPTLGFTFPFNEVNNSTVWNSKINAMSQQMASLGYRKSLTFAGRVLIAKSLILSKIWYVATVIAPSPDQIKDIQGRVWKFIFGKSCIHPSRPIALLPRKCGGIDAPDVTREIQAYSAHLYYQAILQQETPWGHFFLDKVSTYTNPMNNNPAIAFLQEARKSPGRRGWRAQCMDFTLVNALIAWHHIQKHAGGIIEEDWTHKQLKYIIKPKQLTPVKTPLLVKQPNLKGLNNFRWEQLWRPEFPPKIREIIWRMAFNALPSRNRLRHFTNLEQNCTLCGEYEDGPHMVRWCPELKHFFGSLHFLCSDLTDRTGNLIYGIAHYAAYLDNVQTRLHGQTRSKRTLTIKFRGLLTHFYNRSRPDIQREWPSGDLIDRSLLNWASLPPPLP